MSRMVGPSRLLRRVFFEPLLSATKDSSIVLTIYSYRGTERSIRWKDIKSLMKSWTSLLSTATHQQTDSHHHSARVISTQVGGGGVLYVLMEGIQVSKPPMDISARYQRTRLYLCPWIPSGIVRVCVSVWQCIQTLSEATFTTVIVWVKLPCS